MSAEIIGWRDEKKGLDISNRSTRSVDDLYRKGGVYDYVITVCDENSAEDCPAFRNPCRRLHWTFDEPSRFRGTPEEILEKTR